MTTCLAFVNTILIATEDFEDRVRLRNEFAGEKGRELVPRSLNSSSIFSECTLFYKNIALPAEAECAISHLISCRNVISIEHTASAIFVPFWLVFPFRERENFTRLSKQRII